MKFFGVPPQPRSLAFDIDGTLYENEDYIRCQTDLIIARPLRANIVETLLVA
jgi:hydroxymethylpyrimidine pyrophosphatase-like HAD family hydrolase